jgi:putative methyltransferase (TIGR04325 family)
MLTRLFGSRQDRIKLFDTRELANSQIEDGYESQILVNSVIRKTQIFERAIKKDSIRLDLSSLRILVAITLLHPINRKIKILDLGGAAGFHYLVAKKLTKNEYDWHVIETPLMCETANHSKLKNNELTFCSLANLNQKQFDLLFSSSSLQYMDNPLEVLKNILTLKPKFLFITRTPMSNAQSFFYVQESLLSSNGPGPLPEDLKNQLVRYPISILPKSEYLNLITEHYSVIAEVDEGVWGPTIRGEKIKMFGFIAKLNTLV